MNIITGALLALGLALPGVATAQDFPSGQVTMVVPFSAGGSNDTIGRYLAEQLGQAWGRNLVVENRPGAGAAVGANYVARSKPDGRTMLFVSGTLTTTGATRRNLTFDPAKDLQPVGLGAFGKMIIVASPDRGLKSLDDVVAKAKNQTVFYGDTGVGSITQFAAEVFAKQAGIKMEPVHYKGGTDALVDLAGGRIDIYAGTVTQVKSTVDSGKAVPVAVSSKTRTDVFPDVPTIAEAGYPGAEAEIWWGVFVPAGTDAGVVEKINADINTVMNTDASREFLANLGAEPARMTVEEFTAHVNGELETWKAIAKELDLYVE